MTNAAPDAFETRSQDRLTRAEQTGLRLALACRSAITGAAFAWYVLAAFLFPEVSPRTATIAVLLAFTMVGVVHLAIIGTRYDQRWIKYAVYALDSFAICAAFALVPISRAADIPQIIAFRAYGIYFLFPLLAMSCLSLSWRLVLWTGGAIILGWWAAFTWVVARMDSTLSWADIPSHAQRDDYVNTFLSIDFIGRGNRIEETAMILFAALALAIAVYRARAVFFAQVAADLEWRQERALRERVSGLLGKYVPEAIARKLIADDKPLKPQRGHGTVLVMDIAGFTAYSALHPPEVVIETLDHFLADAAQSVSNTGGIVISYIGDGFLVTFNAPLALDRPEHHAVSAAIDLLDIAKTHGFDIRIGLASGDLVTGIIGNDARQSFTVYGDAVNLAARLEAQAKTLGARILADEATFTNADHAGRLQSRSEVSIKGLDSATAVFTLG
ncbi:adenylate/guanylate cyclase domain-containing protein [Sulfitobacter sp. S190]|uniref:adenylate/guanylate cyclase domain-containing protein n=1 Tax=Sulfitobacter sp. S190 TaxID=2867022 RepID=UPI0021A73E03|nr:adenylate/guanylate cyclase domain-containing protein [Sulfitobacter sp. S190]UWR21753.1 adenylate/guanylate cyclase domain-containing protein [Sulfitobacter sp. S190]